MYKDAHTDLLHWLGHWFGRGEGQRASRAAAGEPAGRLQARRIFVVVFQGTSKNSEGPIQLMFGGPKSLLACLFAA